METTNKAEAAREFADESIMKLLDALEGVIPFMAEVCRSKEAEMHYKDFPDRVECWLDLFQQLDGACKMRKAAELKMLEKR